MGTAHQNLDVVGSAQRPSGSAVAYGGKAVIRAASPLLSTRGTPKFARRETLLATSLRALFVAPLHIFQKSNRIPIEKEKEYCNYSEA